MTFEWTERTCPLCGSNKEARVFAESNIDLDKLTEFAFASRKLPEYMHPRLLECGSCGILYGNPVLSPDSLSVLYREAAFDSHEESELASWIYFRIVQDYLGRLPDRKGAIDIGAGDGTFCERLLESGFMNVVGIEPSEAPIAASNPKIRKHLLNQMFRAADFSPDTVSLITCFQVMEHVTTPMEIASSAMRILKPKGLFMAVAHNQRSLSATILGLKSPIYDIEHLQLFTKKSARKLLENAGFEQIQVFPIWNRYPLQYWARLFPLPDGIKSGLSSMLKTTRLGNIRVSIPAGNLVLLGFKPA